MYGIPEPVLLVTVAVVDGIHPHHPHLLCHLPVSLPVHLWVSATSLPRPERGSFLSFSPVLQWLLPVDLGRWLNRHGHNSNLLVPTPPGSHGLFLRDVGSHPLKGGSVTVCPIIHLSITVTQYVCLLHTPAHFTHLLFTTCNHTLYLY